MHTILGVVIVSSLAFLLTMFDNYFAFAAQLVVTDHSRFRRVSWAQATAMIFLVALAGGIGTLLSPIPIRWIGVLCVFPFAFALHAWRHRSSPRDQFRRGSVTTFAVTLSLGADNLAVWIPLLRTNGIVHSLITVVTFAVWELLFLVSAQRLTKHPRVVEWGRAHAPATLPYVYVALGVLILVECHTF